MVDLRIGDLQHIAIDTHFLVVVQKNCMIRLKFVKRYISVCHFYFLLYFARIHF
jgi:hypothetical protein